MDDRELRDEIEVLDTKLREAKRRLAAAQSTEAVELHLAELRAKIAAARGRRAALTSRIRADQARKASLDEDAIKDFNSLEDSRREIASLEPLGDPLGRQPGHGCFLPVVAALVCTASAMSWWLA